MEEAVGDEGKDCCPECPLEEEQNKSNLKVTSPEDAEQHLGRRQAASPPNGTPASRAADPKGSRTVPRRHTVAGSRSSREVLAMQPPEMDKKREAFLEHLKQKYPHHASAIMGHQERLREQCLQGMLSSLHSELDFQRYLVKLQWHHRSRSPKHGPSPQPSVCDQADHLSLASLESLDTMSEADAPTAFTRGSRVRASLPVVRSTNQTKDRSLGVLYLQYGDETKQIRMPNEITSGDTVRALFVGAFPQQLTMKMLESPSVAVYVKDDMRNMYYELTDVRNITDHSCLKVYHKDPAQAFNHGPRPTNGDARMHREMMYGPPPHPLRQPPMGPPPHHPMQGSMSPPMPHSMPPSPSRIPFGPRQGSVPVSATMPRDRMPSATPPARSVSPCPSAILERRDVKPDEDIGGKGPGLARGGGPNEALYADPYMLHGPHGGPPPPPGGLVDGPEHGLVMGGYHRASIRSTGSSGGGYSASPTDTVDHPSLYRQKSRNSQLPTLGSKTPPPSPHRMTEMRMIDIHGGGPPPMPHGLPPHAVPPMERCSPVRQSFRKEEGSGAKPRSNSNLGPSPPVGDLQGHVPGPPGPQANDPQTRERPPKTSSPAHSAHSAHSSGGSPVLAPKSSAAAAAPSDRGPAVPLQANIMHCKRNVSDLRLQLQQMRQLQLHNQEALRVQLKHTEQEISVKLAEAMRRVEDPLQRQRTLVEEDRHKYLGLEERVLAQLSDLEQFVDSLKKDTGGTNRAVTLKDVEEGAVTLRKVGESLAGLKGEFPALQTRMRAVLRVEVEAVRFLKEEPHKLDTMLKRVKSLTESLSSLRRCATEINQKACDQPASVSLKAPPVETGLTVAASESGPHVDAPPAPSSDPAAQPEPQTSTLRSEVMPSSPVVIHHVQSSPVHMQQSQQSAALTTQPSPPLTPSPTLSAGPLLPGQGQGRDSPKAAAAPADPPSPVRNKKTPVSPINNGKPNLVIEELQSSQGKGKNRAMSIEAAEREWEEKRQNMGHYDGKEFAKILQEAQVNMMKGIPSLDTEDKSTAPHAATGEQADSPNPAETTSDEPQSSPTTEKPSKPVPEKLPKPVLEKPVKPILERPVKASTPATTTKPAVSGEKVTKLGSEKVSKSPPPPPPRKTYPSANSGMTTTRSGEVVYTSSRKDSLTAQEGEEEGPPPSPQPKPAKAPAETLAKSPTPPPVSAVAEEEDEGDKIMAELQVFQKCSVKDVGVKNVADPATTRIEPQIRELRPGALLPLKEKKTQNGRAHSSSSSSSFSSSSSSSPSPLSPTPLGPGGKSIRTIHTPSFTSYRPHNGASGKSCIPTATAAKDTI